MTKARRLLPDFSPDFTDADLFADELAEIMAAADDQDDELAGWDD